MPPFRLDDRPGGARTAPPSRRSSAPDGGPARLRLGLLGVGGEQETVALQPVGRLGEGGHVVAVVRVQRRQAGGVEGGRGAEQRAEAGPAAGLAGQRRDGSFELRETDAPAGVAELVALDRRRVTAE